MVDVIYNVLSRPLATDPDKKDVYHVDPAHRDGKVKRAEEDDAKEGKEQHQKFASYLEMEEERKDEHIDKKLEPEYTRAKANLSTKMAMSIWTILFSPRKPLNK